MAYRFIRDRDVWGGLSHNDRRRRLMASQAAASFGRSANCGLVYGQTV